MKLLLAEDEKELSKALVAILKHNNYTVDAVYDGKDAYIYAQESYDAIILDIMMPKMNGLEVLKKLREDGITTPVLLLTARAEVDDRIAGLDLGADDYLTKPFAMGELLARIRSITRRKSEYLPNDIALGNTTLSRVNYEISTKSGSVKLSNKEYQMLEMLMAAPKRLFSTEQLMEKIWGYDSEAEINVVWVYVSYLRKKLQQINSNIEIKATRGVGYSVDIGK